MSPDLFPVEASEDAKKLISAAVKAAASDWGEWPSCFHCDSSFWSHRQLHLCLAFSQPFTVAEKSVGCPAGERQLTELEAEDRLAFACEKAPTTDTTSMKVTCWLS